MTTTRLGWPALGATVDKRQREMISGKAKQAENIFISLMLDDFKSCSSVCRS